MIEINGSYLEGGGQIVRTAVALSAILKIPCRVFNIRKGRKEPGLKHQHLLGLRALAELCHGKLEGDEIGSLEIRFFPGEIKKEKILIKIPTAASITLILQTLLPPSLFAPFPVEIVFEGGATDTFFSPTLDYFRYVFLNILEKMGVKMEIEVLKRGYYPEGKGQVRVKVVPRELRSLNLTLRGKLKKILAISGASESLKEKKVAERQIVGVREIFDKIKLPLEEKIEYYDTECPGSQICLIAEFENTVMGTDSLGKLGKRAEEVGREAALELLKEEKSQACVDKHLADQILPYLSLVKRKSKIKVSEITNHCQTNIWVIEKFLPGHFEIKNHFISWIPKS